MNEKVSELEKQHKKVQPKALSVHYIIHVHPLQKLEAVRGSYRQQLVNAIQKIAGEYKVALQLVYTHSACCLLVVSCPDSFREGLGKRL